MARPRKKPASPETRDTILRAARIEFAAQGLTAPLDAIAERCGIRRPSLLHHFPSKKALLEAVIDDVVNKARQGLVTAIGDGGGDYEATMQLIMRVLRELEREEEGVAGVLLHSLLQERDTDFVTQRMTEFIDVIYSTALIAGANRNRSAADIKAVIAHLVMGEFTRIALGSRASNLWGEVDAIDPLFKSYFLDSETDSG